MIFFGQTFCLLVYFCHTPADARVYGAPQAGIGDARLSGHVCSSYPQCLTCLTLVKSFLRCLDSFSQAELQCVPGEHCPLTEPAQTGAQTCPLNLLVLLKIASGRKKRGKYAAIFFSLSSNDVVMWPSCLFPLESKYTSLGWLFETSSCNYLISFM